MNISVVVATYNRRDSLRNCLAALQEQTLAPHEIIVVDDASTDGSVQMIAGEFAAVIVLAQPGNRGPAAARNRGIAQANGEAVAFTDDDCVPPPTWLEQLAAGFQQHPGVVGVSGYQEAGDELLAANWAARADRAMRLQSTGPQADEAQQGGVETPGFGTNNAAYLRSALLDVGGFDESFRVASGEDTDLKVRICEAAQHKPEAPAEGPLLYLPLKVRHDRDYTVHAQWRLGFKRGMGAYHFERKHARAPGVGRIALRFGIRSVRFLRDLWQQPGPVAVIIYLTRLADCFGQLRMAVGRPYAEPPPAGGMAEVSESAAAGDGESRR